MCKKCPNEDSSNDGYCWDCYVSNSPEWSARQRKEIHEVKDWWNRETPDEFKLKVTRIPELPDRSGFRQITRWWQESYYGGKRWLYVYGKTGVGKTRSLYLLMRIIARGFYPEDWPQIVQGGQFAKEVIERTRPLKKGEERAGSLREYLDPLYDSNVVWIDENDKLKFTERVEDEFFSLVDHRYAHQKYTIISGPCSPTDLKKKMGAEDGPQIIRRIVQSSLIVRFVEAPKPNKLSSTIPVTHEISEPTAKENSSAIAEPSLP